ncbi:MAG: superfamily helicase [Paenibacillus sp.]|nr:superfamily helicase [Paenibacillus sp.]
MAKRNELLPKQEIYAILRAADDIIAQGGRTLLSKILKGSKDKKVQELGLEKNPAYGYFADLTLEAIMQKIDHMIKTDFLETQLNWKLPTIVFTARGWAVERERLSVEFLREWDLGIDNRIIPISFDYLKDCNRGLILLFLYQILRTGNKKYISYLKLWERTAYKKIKAEIRNVIDALEQRETMNDIAWEDLKRVRAETLLQAGKAPIFLDCYKCPRVFVFNERDPDYYTEAGLQFPTLCPTCLDKMLS